MIRPGSSTQRSWSPPAASRFVSYIRSRPSRQAETLLGVEAQRMAAAWMLGEGDNVLLEEFWELELAKPRALRPQALFGERPALSQAIRYCLDQDATLLIAHIGRLATSRAFLERLERTQVRFVACDMPELDHRTIGAAIAKAWPRSDWHEGPIIDSGK